MSGDAFVSAEENGDPAAAPDLFRWLSREVRELMPREVPVLEETPAPRSSFRRNFVAANRPCVVRGAVDHWPARELWTAPYLSAALGDTPVSVNVTPTGLGDALLSTEGTDLRFRGEDEGESSGNAARDVLGFLAGSASSSSSPRLAACAFRGSRASVRKAFRKTGDTHTLDSRAPATAAYVSAQNDSFSAEFASALKLTCAARRRPDSIGRADAFGCEPAP